MASVLPVMYSDSGSTRRALREQKVCRAEIAAALKHDMLNRGMSSDEIRTILATPGPESADVGHDRHR